ncbi:MAG: NUDIX domain-containing protein [Planctomycetes bacterium]|nr:NUDIX domain-containing protein [Planctomycetota bacterium]
MGFHRRPRIRPLSLGVFRHQGRILVSEGQDSVKGETFYRLLGGGIEFGERGREALVREIREELSVGVSDLRYLGTLENVFVYEGLPGHELCLVYEARLDDPGLYRRERFSGHEEGEGAFPCLWKDVAEFGPEAPLYPDGALGLVRGGPPQL